MPPSTEISLSANAIVQIIFLIGQLFFVAYLAHLARQDRRADRQLLESMDRIETLLTKEAQQRRIIQKVTSH